ncbi:hypothetical protein GEMRC1_003599 [Eukaryota sp. GEM-RC1]
MVCDPNSNPVDSLIHLSFFSLLIGIGLCIGLAISHRTSKGLSGVTLLLANLNHFNVAFNSVVLNIVRFKACSIVGFWGCFPSILSFITLMIGFITFFPVLVLFLVYFEKRDNKRARSYSICLWAFLSFLTYAVIVIAVVCVLVYFYNRCHFLVLELAYATGLASTVINLWQWIPQILITYKRKGSGALSIAMIAFQAPGSALMLVFLILSGAGISTWGSYFTSAVQQLILLYLLVFYTIRKRKRAKIRALEQQGVSNSSSTSPST